MDYSASGKQLSTQGRGGLGSDPSGGSASPGSVCRGEPGILFIQKEATLKGHGADERVQGWLYDHFNIH